MAPGLNPDTSPILKLNVRFLFVDPTLRPSERKTTREAGLPLRPSQPSVSRTEKARNLPISQRLTQKRRRSRRQTVLSCCRPDMGWQSWRFEVRSRKSPHNLVYNYGSTY